MAVELAEAYISLIPSAKGIQSRLASELGGPETTAAAADAGEAASEGFIGRFAGAGAKITGLITAGLAVGAVGVGTALFNLGGTFDDAFDKIRVQTGATGDTLARLQGNVQDVFSSVPTDLDSASTAIATLNQKLGLTDEPLNTLATQVLNLSRITDTDLGGNLTAVTDLFNNFGVAAGDQPAKLDELFRASQATGVSVADLASGMADSGITLRTLGFTFEDSAALLGSLNKAGVDSSEVMPALSKTLATAAKDGKDAKTVFNDTFAAIKNAPDSVAAAGVAMDTFGAKAGPKLSEAIRTGKISYEELAKSIATGGDTIDAASADTADFAEKWTLFKNNVMITLQPIAEKVFGAVADAAGKIIPVIEDLMEKADPIFSTITEWVGTTLLGVFHEAAPIVADLFGKLVDFGGQAWDVISKIDFKAVFSGAMQVIQPLIDAVKDYLIAYFNLLWSSAQTLFQLFQDNKATIEAVAVTIKDILAKGAEAAGAAIGVMSTVFRTLADHMGAVKAVVIPLAAAFVAYQTITIAFTAAQWLITTATQAWAAAQALLNGAMTLNPIGVVIALIAGLVAGAIYAYTHFQTFRDIINSMWDTIRSAFNWVATNWPLLLAILTGPIGLAVLEITRHWEEIKAGFSSVKDWIYEKIGDIVGFATGLPGRISTAVAGMWDGIKDAFRAAINFVIDGWNSLGFSLPRIDWGPVHIGGQHLQVPQIPRLESGAVATSPMLALIGETARARPEIVTPQALMAETFDAVLDKRGGGQQQPIVINIHGFVGGEAEMMRKINDGLRDYQAARD